MSVLSRPDDSGRDERLEALSIGPYTWVRSLSGHEKSFTVMRGFLEEKWREWMAVDVN